MKYALFCHSCTQQELYEETVRPLVNSVLDGFNGTIFAYGQTGTGKTYTMEGEFCTYPFGFDTFTHFALVYWFEHFYFILVDLGDRYTRHANC